MLLVPLLSLALPGALPPLFTPPAVPPQEIFSEEDYDANAKRLAARDAFPVLDAPEHASAAAGDQELDPEEPVIGVVFGGEAMAYPVSIMGLHELANDVVGGVPIAASW